jgi:hypothetical protein
MASLVQVCLFLIVGIAWSTGQSSNQFSYISAKGNELLAIDQQFAVNRFVNGTWQKLTAGAPDGYKAISVGASPDGWSWMCLENGYIYRWNLDSGKWEVQPGGIWQINAISKNLAIGIDINNNAYETVPSGNSYYWAALANAPTKIKWVSIGENGERWVIDTKGLVYRKNNGTGKFDRFSGNNAVNLDVQSSDRVVMTTQCCWVYMLNGNNWVKQDLPGCTKQATITHNNAYYVDELDNFGAATFQ